MSSNNVDTYGLTVGTLTAEQCRRAALTLADRAADAAELAVWLDMLGLPEPRPLRKSVHSRSYEGSSA